jgi:hypothetical protein
MRNHALVRTLLGFAICTFVGTAAFAASPRLTLIMPRGVQRGAEHVLTFTGSNLGDAQEVFFYEPAGFEVSKVEPNGNSCKVTVKVAAECRLGEHVAQLRTASGISDYRTLYVEPYGAVAEKEPNSEFEMPQAISLGVTVAGTIGNEDVDFYVFDAKKGQRISAEVVAMRLSNALFDPYVAILDAKRFELSANDDTALALQDAFASVVAPEDGKYIVEVRESAYGNGSRYRLHVGTFPRPTAVYPAGGKLGEATDVRFLGDPTGDIAAKVALPTRFDNDFGVFASDASGVSPTPNAFRLFEHGNALESEPNDAVAQATAAQLPLAFNGIIEKDGDVDCFKFAAKKGQAFNVECYARRIRSGLDSVMNIYYANGKSIAGNDDSRGPDSYLRFNVPADGEYVVRITDHLKKGRADFVYRVEFQAVKPELSLSIPRVERYGQYRQQIYVARGNRFATLINASRANFAGELVLEGKDLPQGVTVNAEPMRSNLSSMPVVFEAAADAPLSGKLVDFTAKHTENEAIRGGFKNRADFIVSAPGQSLYRWKDVDRLAVAVVDELPFKLEIVAPKVPLVRNGEMQLKVVAHKKAGWDEQINVQFPFRPPGVSARSSINIPKGKTEVLYPINANASAQIGDWKVYALGSANVGGTAWASTPLTKLSIAEPYVTFSIQRAACEQGQEAPILCKLTQKTAFEGEATLKLVGLPPKVTTTELKFNKESKELIFPVKTDASSPVGKHNLYCQMIIPQSGEQIVSRAGSVQLQIDKPLPAPVVAKPAPKPQPKAAPTAVVVKKPDPPKAKPLSRLEKLRLAAKQRREAQNAAGGGGE